MDYSYKTIKTFNFYIGDKENDKFEFEGKPKYIEIVNYGVHTSNNAKKVYVEVDLGSFLPGMNLLYCHCSGDSSFLNHTSLMFSNNIPIYNGSFKITVKDIYSGNFITDVYFVL